MAENNIILVHEISLALKPRYFVLEQYTSIDGPRLRVSGVYPDEETARRAWLATRDKANV